MPQVNRSRRLVHNGQSGATVYKTNNVDTCPCHVQPANLRQRLCATGDTSRHAWLRDTRDRTARAAPDVGSGYFFERVTSSLRRRLYRFTFPSWQRLVHGVG